MKNGQRPIVILSLARYPLWAVPFAFLSMALFRLPLWRSKRIGFYKLMGSGRNGTFDKTPDLRQWALMATLPQLLPEHAGLDQAMQQVPSFIHHFWKCFGCRITTYLLEPIEGHGLWDGQQPFGELPKNTDHEGPIAVMTRATIRLRKLKGFWSNVDRVAAQMAGADGFIRSYGIGEVPFIKQATFSIWQSKAHMKQFAYQMREHAEVVRMTRQQDWYSEELFVRFRILHEQVNG